MPFNLCKVLAVPLYEYHVHLSQGTDSPTQRGVIHNLLALCLRRQDRIPEAGWHLHSALVISRESGNQRNQALALANLGCLALDAGASLTAERFLVRLDSRLIVKKFAPGTFDLNKCRVYKGLFILVIIVSPDLSVSSWSCGKDPRMRSMFRPTSGSGGATKTGGGGRTAGRVSKWGCLLHYMPETYTVSTS